MITIKKQYMNLIVMVLVIFALAYAFPPVCVVFVYAGVIYGAVKNNKTALYLFLVVCIFQNFILLLCADRFDGIWTTLFTLSKEIMIYGCVVLAFFRKAGSIKPKTKDFIFAAYLLVLLFAFITSDTSVYARVVSLRSMLLPFVCFYFGLMLNVREDTFKKIVKFIITIAIIIAILGLIERFVIGDSFWTSLPIERYQINRGTTFKLYNGVPLNYYTWDYTSITHKVERRLVSLLVDPLMTGHFLFMAFVMAKYALVKSKSRSAIRALLLICSLLTLSKGVYVAVIIYIAVSFIGKFSFRQMVTILGAAIVAICSFIGTLYGIFHEFMPTSSIIIHMNAFFSAFTNISIGGAGLGTAGVITNKLSGGGAEFGGESFIAVVLYQLGLPGLILFIVFFASVILILLKKYKTSNNILFFLSSVLLIGLLFESMFSESSVSIVGTGMYFVISGIAVSYAGSKSVSTVGEAYRMEMK